MEMRWLNIYCCSAQKWAAERQHYFGDLIDITDVFQDHESLMKFLISSGHLSLHIGSAWLARHDNNNNNNNKLMVQITFLVCIQLQHSKSRAKMQTVSKWENEPFRKFQIHEALRMLDSDTWACRTPSWITRFSSKTKQHVHYTDVVVVVAQQLFSSRPLTSAIQV